MKNLLKSAVLGWVFFTSGLALAADTVPWTYSGERGPENWADLSPEFADCDGKNQSPINLTGFTEADLRPFKVSYRTGGEEILNNGHTVQVNFGAGSGIAVDGIQFELLQVHFHAPSENRINGRSFPLEAHLVHADEEGNLAVVAIMFEEGAENEALSTLWSVLPDQAGERIPLEAGFSASQLLPANTDYYRFNGSLTTPPCTEGVRWLVLKTAVSASKEQVEKLLHAVGGPNNRPVQPVHARPVLQ